MNVLLIQPPAPPKAIEPLHIPTDDPDLFSPPWDLMCLQTFVLERTRHTCRFVDCRLFTNLDEELVRTIESVPSPRIIVVHAPVLSIGEVSAVVDIAKRHFPNIRIVLFGNYPTEFPEEAAAMPRIDFALAGDPEPILRNLLDYIDVRQRLRRVPGLIIPGETQPGPSWVNKLQTLSLAQWNDVFWRAYTVGRADPICRTEARLSRGHSNSAADRAFGGRSAPLRFWPMDRMATLVQKCSHMEIHEVHIGDPPGIWTPEILSRWCNALLDIRNVQPWSLRLYPTAVKEEGVMNLVDTRCRRLEIIFPSCDRNLLEKYGIAFDPRAMTRMLAMLQEWHLPVHARFWIGGPEESRGETERIVQMARRFKHCHLSVHPYPFHPDSTLYEELWQNENMELPRLDEWIRWSLEPWMVERPLSLWKQKENLESLNAQLVRIRKAINRDPHFHIARFLEEARSRNWIEVLEDKALHFLRRALPAGRK